jgi:hypothetical protein
MRHAVPAPATLGPVVGAATGEPFNLAGVRRVAAAPYERPYPA